MRNKYPLPWRTRLRLRLGNTWAFASRRRADLKAAAAVLVVFAGYGLVGRMDYESALASEAHAQAARAQAAEQLAIECLNGRARWISADGHTLIACEKAMELTL